MEFKTKPVPKEIDNSWVSSFMNIQRCTPDEKKKGKGQQASQEKKQKVPEQLNRPD